MYRAARAFRRIGVIVLVVLIIFAGTVAYSAYETAHATVESRSLSGVFLSNGVLNVSGSFTVSNPGFYPIEGLELSAQVANDSGIHLATVAVGPKTIEGGSTGLFPISVGLPVSASSAAESLLFRDQYLEVAAWANVTYAYFFPLSVALTETRAWGAPFEGFYAAAGTPTYSADTVSAPVTVSWANHASFVERGVLVFVIESASLVQCGGGSFPTNVAPGQLFNQTQDVTLNPSCSPAGGELLLSYTIDGTETALPPEPIP